MIDTKKLISNEDASVNFVLANGQEARYVRRNDDYFIVYLSSHNGCNKACRFCHLTQTGQTAFDEASVEDMLQQATLVLAHYADEVSTGRQPAAGRVHFNWMARGEPLASSVVVAQWAELSERLTRLATEVGVTDVAFNLSTIFPAAMSGRPLQFGGPHQPTLFYSLYSLDPVFRRRWLPNALAPEDALKQIALWQRSSGGKVVLHWALILGENDSAAEAARIVEAITRHGLRARFNLVRYNPFSTSQGEEAPANVLQQRFSEIEAAMRVPGSRMVPRVGFDVKASCGMFVPPGNV